jgi:mono/diheme cytochrome c family protein
MRRHCRTVLLGAITYAAALGWSAAFPLHAQDVPRLPSDLPEGEGRDLVRFHCAICHDLGIVRQQRLSERLWTEVLRDMRGFGAVFTDEQRAKIVAYLVKHFGP